MILQRIIGRRGSGRTTVALSQAYANSPSGRLSLYACRSMDDANRCYRNYVDRWRGATFKRYFVEWQKRNTRGTHYLRFVSPHVWLPGTPEDGFEPDPIKPLPQSSSVQVRREMMRQLRGLT